jgi:hypothetical protein
MCLCGIDLPKMILEQLKAHTKLEKLQGMEVHPAMRQPRMTPKSQQADRRKSIIPCSERDD